MKSYLSGAFILLAAVVLFFAHFGTDSSDAYVAALVAMIAAVGVFFIAYTLGFRSSNFRRF